MADPCFSIIIPSFNAGDCIGNALDSILVQSFRDYEIIVVDGLSEDSTRSIVDDYISRDSRIRLLCEKDYGVYDAMNKGIALAKGTWCYFLGSDDRLTDKETLQNISEQIQKTSASVVYGNVLISGSTFWAEHNTVYDGEFSLGKMLYTNICHQAIFYKRKVFDLIGNYNLKYRICADWDFNLRCMAGFQFQYINIIVAIYDGSGLSSADSDAVFLNDKVKNISTYFNKKLYKDEFINYRHSFRKILFEHGNHMGLMNRLIFFFNLVILHLKGWKRR